MKNVILALFTVVLVTGCTLGPCPAGMVKQPIFGGK